MESTTRDLSNLQIIRAIAAMMVVTNHFLGGTLSGIFRMNGGFGVDIFFVLSGFLMIHTLNHHKTPFNFFISRVRRIYPLYITLSFPLIITTFMIKDYSTILCNLFLLPGLNNPEYHLANSPAWTLVYEMIFYFIFSISLIFSKNKVVTCILVCTAIISCVATINGYQRMGWVNLGYILSDPLMLNFAAGCAIAAAYGLTKQLTIPKVISVVSILLLMRIALVDLSHLERVYKFGIPAILIIFIAVHTEMLNGNIADALRKIGDASYSIYLSHTYVAMMFHDIKDLNNNWFVTLYSSQLLVVSSILFGIFIYKSIEKPIDDRLRKKIRN